MQRNGSRPWLTASVHSITISSGSRTRRHRWSVTSRPCCRVPTASTPRDSSYWCCVGSGFESHVGYARFIYGHDGDKDLFVNLLIPSRLTWQGTTLTQTTNFPQSGTTTLTFTGKPRRYNVHLRRPAWASSVSVKVNGKKAKDIVWKKNDIIIPPMPSAPSKHSDKRRKRNHRGHLWHGTSRRGNKRRSKPLRRTLRSYRVVGQTTEGGSPIQRPKEIQRLLHIQLQHTINCP